MNIEAGYQRRFELAGPLLTFVPGLLLGYEGALGPLVRGVGCQGCREQDIHGVDASGIYLAPFVRMTLVSLMGVSVRWQWFLTGALTNFAG